MQEKTLLMSTNVWTYYIFLKIHRCMKVEEKDSWKCAGI